MNDERAFIARVESANVEALAEIFRQPTREEEETLRTYFGDQRYRRMHGLALQGKQRSIGTPPQNVVVLHGIMGGELTRVPTGKAGIHIWLNIPRVVWGEFAYCRLNDDGRTEKHDIRVTGILKRYYGELLLYLHSKGWNVKPFWYDWRKDIRTSASLLESQLRNWFPDEGPVHFVAHSMGGLVVRAFMKMYKERWNTLASCGSRLIMLGTPNFGSFSTVQVLTGTESSLRLLARLDFRNSLRDICGIASTFPGCYQMLPSPDAMPAMEALYQPETWRQLPALSQRHLADARGFQQWLNEDIEAQSIYIAGFNKPTVCDIQRKSDTELFPTTDFDNAKNENLYRFTLDGDGTVPHNLGFLRDEQPVFKQVYYVEEEHGRLPVNRYVMQGVSELLKDNTTSTLASAKPGTRGGIPEREIAQQWQAMHELDSPTALAERLSARARSIAAPVAMRSAAADNGAAAPDPAIDTDALDRVPVGSDERKLENAALRSFLYDQEDASRGRVRRESGDRPAIEIRLVKGSIEDPKLYDAPNADSLAVDCISVGHYMGIRPQQAELALDEAISRHLAGAAPAAQSSAGTSAETRQQDGNSRSEFSERDQILTQFTERGTLIGQLGQPFMLADPRDTTGQRLIAIAGMGLPGSFGVPELTVLVRELCWALGQLGKRQLVTVLIGGGSGNMSTADAVQGWLRGIRQAVGGANETKDKRLQRITFVEQDPRRIRALRTDFENAAEQISGLQIDFDGPSDKEVDSWRDEALERDRKDFEGRKRDSASDAPTCMTVQMVGEAFHFGAITRDASIPERVIKIDSRIVLRANDKLAAAADPFEQFQHGRFLERLLIPRDLRGQLATRAPLVMIVDRTTARLHWELFAQPDPVADMNRSESPAEFDPNRFLGTARGLTRQFRTILAPPPEPPPPPRRVLRVLVVADPAADARLPGAEQEGMEVADLFESFNTTCADWTPNRIEVERLFGPYEATCENVLQRLMLEDWDILHFAGHCYYNAAEPSASGWIFNAKEREILSANELRQVDRVPKFVFSNACESGVTPDRSEKRDPRLAPSFAEAFFERGVANIVCTAWPVDDVAARLFAERLYRALLGLPIPDSQKKSESEQHEPKALKPDPKAMHDAMQGARVAVAKKQHGGRTWGAYQHYGNPNFRLLDASSFYERAQGVEETGEAPAAKELLVNGSPPSSPQDRPSEKSESVRKTRTTGQRTPAGR